MQFSTFSVLGISVMPDAFSTPGILLVRYRSKQSQPQTMHAETQAYHIIGSREMHREKVDLLSAENMIYMEPSYAEYHWRGWQMSKMTYRL